MQPLRDLFAPDVAGATFYLDPVKVQFAKSEIDEGFYRGGHDAFLLVLFREPIPDLSLSIDTIDGFQPDQAGKKSFVPDDERPVPGFRRSGNDGPDILLRFGHFEREIYKRKPFPQVGTLAVDGLKKVRGIGEFNLL